MRIVMTINEPVPFGGTEEEKDANWNTHQWWYDPQTWEQMCDHCGSKVWHKAAMYPCHAEVPRRDVVIVEDENGKRYQCDPELLAIGVLGLPS